MTRRTIRLSSIEVVGQTIAMTPSDDYRTHLAARSTTLVQFGSTHAICGSLVRRSCLVIFLIDRGYAQDAVIKYSREYYPDRALERTNPLIIWLPDLGSNQGPAD